MDRFEKERRKEERIRRKMMQRNQRAARTNKRVKDGVKFPAMITFLLLFIASMILALITTFIITLEINVIVILRAFGTGAIIFLLFAILYMYMHAFKIERYETRTLMALYSIIYFTIIISVIMQKTINIFVAPIASATMAIGMLLRKKVALIASIYVPLIILIINYMLGSSIVEIKAITSIMFINFIFSNVIMYIVFTNQSRSRIFWGTLLMGIVFFPVYMLINLLISTDIIHLVLLSVYTLIGIAFSIILYTAYMPFAETLFKIWTNAKLAEFSSFSQPLLMRMARYAPGTFQHSLAVGNLAELCAIKIGENPYLARLSGYYHDIGKIKNPEFFIENQAGGYNPHDDLIPEASVQILTAHTRNGFEMLKKYRVPEEVIEVAVEHHGTTVTQYFYKKAQDITEDKLDSTSYKYPGPTPTNKISAIVMICDIVEATIRSRPMNKEELDVYIKTVIEDKIKTGQFDRCNITIQELHEIRETIANTLPSMNHSRIDYVQKKRRRF